MSWHAGCAPSRPCCTTSAKMGCACQSDVAAADVGLNVLSAVLLPVIVIVMHCCSLTSDSPTFCSASRLPSSAACLLTFQPATCAHTISHRIVAWRELPMVTHGFKFPDIWFSMRSASISI